MQQVLVLHALLIYFAYCRKAMLESDLERSRAEPNVVWVGTFLLLCRLILPHLCLHQFLIDWGKFDMSRLTNFVCL